MQSYFDHEFEQFNNRGSILNLQGFPGAVEIRDNIFRKNMLYIKEVLIMPNSIAEGDTFYTPDQLKYSDWTLPQTSYLRFKVCDENLYTGKYLFQSMFYPHEDFDDE